MPRQAKDGSTPGERKLSAYAGLFENTSEGQSPVWDWQQVDSSLVLAAITVVNGRGDAISFATNRAGTAGAVTILIGGERPRAWFNTYDEAESFFDRLTRG